MGDSAIRNCVIDPLKCFFNEAASRTTTLAVPQKFAEFGHAIIEFGNQFSEAGLCPRLDATFEAVALWSDLWEVPGCARELIYGSDKERLDSVKERLDSVAAKSLSLANIAGTMLWVRSIELCSFSTLGTIGESFGKTRFFGFVANTTLNGVLRGLLVIGFAARTAAAVTVIFSDATLADRRKAGMDALSSALHGSVSAVVLYAGFNPLGLGLVAATVGFYHACTNKEAKAEETGST